MRQIIHVSIDNHEQIITVYTCLSQIIHIDLLYMFFWVVFIGKMFF